MDNIYLSIINQKIMVTNLKEVFAQFSDESVCRQYLVEKRWNGKPVCPYCTCDKSYIIEGGKRFKCGNKLCFKKYSVTVGTVFEASNIPLTTWFAAMYILSAHKKGISSVQLAKDLGVTQKTAWFMNHRIRESLKEKNSPLLSGTVEIDETYMSRKFASEYKGLTPEEVETFEQRHAKPHFKSKGAVVGMKQRNGDIIAIAANNPGANEIQPIVEKYIAKESDLMTDESTKYVNILADYKSRQSVNHSKKEWVRGDVHVNGVENFWSVMKRGIYGIYHQISYKHLQRYCDEFTYRFNSRDIKDGARFYLTLGRIEGRLTYNQLVYGKDTKDKATTTTS